MTYFLLRNSFVTFRGIDATARTNSRGSERRQLHRSRRASESFAGIFEGPSEPISEGQPHHPRAPRTARGCGGLGRGSAPRAPVTVRPQVTERMQKGTPA